MAEKTIVLCRCGYEQENHFFRHIFVPRYELVIETKEKPIVKIQSNQFPLVQSELCAYKQCGQYRGLHGVIIKHEFVSDTKKRRQIKICLPQSLKCRTCNKELRNHNNLNHQFNYEVLVSGTDEYSLSIETRFWGDC